MGSLLHGVPRVLWERPSSLVLSSGPLALSRHRAMSGEGTPCSLRRENWRSRLLQTDQLLALYRYWCRNYGHRLDDGHVGESLCRSPVRLPQGSSCVSSVGFGLGWFRHGTFEEEVRLANESINRARFFQAEDSWAADCGATWILRHARCCHGNVMRSSGSVTCCEFMVTGWAMLQLLGADQRMTSHI